MPDLTTRLAALRSDAPGNPDDSTVDADVRRGHAAVVSRRRRRTAVAGATLGVVGIGAGSYALTGNGSEAPHADRFHRITVTHSPGQAPPSVTRQRPSTSVAPTHAAPVLELAAYHGPQLPGFSVKRIPKGYVLQGVSGSTLDIAKKGDHSDLNTFVGKIVVGVDSDTPRTGTPVTVNGRTGHLRSDDGVMTLTYSDGSHDVVIQSWSTIHISRAQLVQFAEGVTVLPSVQEGHG